MNNLSMVPPSIFKVAQQQEAHPAITTLQSGMYNLINSIKKLLKESDSKSGLYNYLQTYINNYNATYASGAQINGVVDQFTTDNFIVLRDKFIKRLATKNLAQDIPQYAQEPVYKYVVYFGEQVMAIFQPVMQLMSGVKEDPESLKAHGTQIGHALTTAGEQLTTLAKEFRKHQESLKTNKSVEANIRRKYLEKLAKNFLFE